MLLQRLVEYAREQQIPPPLYQKKQVRCIIQLDGTGRYLGLIDLTTEGKSVLAPAWNRTSNTLPFPLVDTAEYLFGRNRPGARTTKTADKHQASLVLHRRMEQMADNALVHRVLHAVANFQETGDLSTLPLPKKLLATDLMTFEVDGIPVEEALDALHPLWQQRASVGKHTQKMCCLVCGNIRPAVERLPILIQGIPNGQSGGLTLISADKPAFQSYGLKASLVAPTCEECGYLFSHALNLLLSQRQTCFRTPSAAYVFWAKGHHTSLITEAFTEAKPEYVKALFEALTKRNVYVTLREVTPFYAAALTGSGKRVAMIDWMETTLEAIQYHLFRFKAFQMVMLAKGTPLFFSLRQLIGATGEGDRTSASTQSERSAKKAGPVEIALVRFALSGRTLPLWLLSRVMRQLSLQVQKGQGILPSQIALISLVLHSHHPRYQKWPERRAMKEQSMAELLAEVEHPKEDPAYLYGQLFAILETIQKRALGSVGAGIVKRFYTAASTVPASTFPRLLQGVHHHLTKLQAGENKLNKVIAFRMSKQLQNVMAALHTYNAAEPFAAKLDVKEQGLFHVGYWCWSMENERAIQAAVAKKQASESAQGTTTQEPVQEASVSLAEAVESFWSVASNSDEEPFDAAEAEER